MANYKARIQLKHGKKADLPTDGRLAEPMYCTDTHELAIGNDKGEEYTFIGGVSEEQIRALERSINKAIELASKSASTVDTDLSVHGVTVGKVKVNNQGVTITDKDNNVVFGIDDNLTTYVDVLNLNKLVNIADVGVMPVTKGSEFQVLHFYISPTMKGTGDGTTRDNASNDIYSIADTIFKKYGYLHPATKIHIWCDPGVYNDDMSIPHIPGNITEVYIQTDVNGTSTFTKPVNIYNSNCSVHYMGNFSGSIKFQSVAQQSEAPNVRASFNVYGSNVNVEFNYCHWVTPITSEYKKYCIAVNPGSMNVNLAFTSCDFYGYDALVYKGEPHGEIIMSDCPGDLTHWIDVKLDGSPNLNSLGLRISITGNYPIVANSNALLDLNLKGSTTATHSRYYVTTEDPGGSGVVIAPPAVTNVTTTKRELYTVGSPEVRVYNWNADFDPSVNPSVSPEQAVALGYGEVRNVEGVNQGSASVVDGNTSVARYYTVSYGSLAFSTELMSHLKELGDKEKSGSITNLSARLLFKQNAVGVGEVRPRVIYTPGNIDIPSHMYTDHAWYVTDIYVNDPHGFHTYVLEFDGEHALASTLKNDFFYNNETSDQLYSRYGDKARYGIQLGSYRAEDLAEFTISLEVTYKEKAVVIG